MPRKLQEVLAPEKGLRQRVNEQLSELHHKSQKADLFDGFVKTYHPYNESDDPRSQVPEQKKHVQAGYQDVLKQSRAVMTDLFDFAAARDWSNQEACADIIIDGVVLVEKVPVSYLLFLDKQLANYLKFVSSLVELDPSIDWKYDAGSEYHKSEPARVQRTEKVQEPIVLHKPTTEHPAQTQLVTKDVPVGVWETVRLSGAIPRSVKLAILVRAQKLKDACLEARAQANATLATEPKVAGKLFDYLLP